MPALKSPDCCRGQRPARLSDQGPLHLSAVPRPSQGRPRAPTSPPVTRGSLSPAQAQLQPHVVGTSWDHRPSPGRSGPSPPSPPQVAGRDACCSSPDRRRSALSSGCARSRHCVYPGVRSVWPFASGFLHCAYFRGCSVWYMHRFHYFFWLNNIPAYGETTTCLCVHSRGHEDFSYLLALRMLLP